MRLNLVRLLMAATLLLLAFGAGAQTQFPLGSNGTMGLGNRNGDFFVEQDDLRVKVPGGYVRINRDYDGREWTFNRQWSGLGDPNYYKASYPALGAYFTCNIVDGVSSCDSTASSGSAMLMAGPLAADYVLPGARIPNDPNFGRTIEGQATPGEAQFIARKGVGFTRSSDGTSYVSSKHPRFIIRPVSVPVLPASAGPDAHPSTGRPGHGGIATTLVDGYRWTDRSGEWIEYDKTGRITSYGDRNDVRVWMQYGSHGQVERVLDDNGRTVFTLLYTSSSANFIREVRDHTPLDGSLRRVQYQYDDKGRLRHVIDARGNTTSFEYGAISSASYESSGGQIGAGTGGSGGGSAALLLVDTRFKLIKVTDAENRVTSIGYGVTARVTKIVAPDGGITEFDYGYDKLKKEFSVTVKYPQTDAGRKLETLKFDQEGRLTFREVNGKVVLTSQGGGRTLSYIDARNGSTTVVRDAFDEVSRITYADGTSRNYVYEAGSTDLREYTNEAGTRWQLRWDGKGNLLGDEGAVGLPERQVTEYVANARGEVELIRRKGGANPDGSVDVDVESRLTYDDYGNVVEFVDGENKHWKYEYDGQGNLTKSIDPMGHAWVYTYDEHGNLRTETDPNSHTVRHEYDRTDRLVATTDARDKTTRFGHDAAGRETTLVNPYGETFTDMFDAAGRLRSRTDAAGQSSALTYDSAGRIAKVVDGESFQTLLEYTDSDGLDRGASRPGKITYPTFQRQFRYDSRNRPTQQTEILANDSLTTGATHDALGRIKTLTDPNGNTRSFQYDAFGRPVSLIDELGATVTLGYDHRHNMVSVTDARGKTTRLSYDRNNNLVAETNAEGQVTRYAYNDAGDQTEIKRPTNARVVMEYDPAGRLETRRSYRADGTAELTDTFDWDAADNLEGWTSDRAQGVLTYDDADRLLSERVTIDGITLTRSYTYHGNGQVKTYTGPDGVTITYAYDGNGQLERVDIPGEGSITATEWTWTAPKKVVLPGGTAQEMERDGLLNLTRLRVKGPNQTTLFDLENRFGKLRELSSRQTDGKLTRFEYDEAVRLTKSDPDFVGGNSEVYTIDKAGNRETHSLVSGTWEYDSANRLLRRGDVSYDYDSAGNMIRKVDADLAEPLRTTRYAYDAYGRLIEVRDGADTLVASYAYDPYDNRIVKEVHVARGGAVPGKTLFLHAEEGLLAEASDAGEVLRSYGWHPEHPYSTYPLFQRAGGAYFYYHNDELGTPWRVTNREGAIVWSASDYSPFGTAKVAAGATIVQPWRFPGQYVDAETGLHYNLRRYYEPATGRYISEDPLGLSAGTNLYSYGRHSPTNFTDPTGEIIPILVNGVRCLGQRYLECVVECMALEAVDRLINDPCSLDWDMLKDCAKDCLWSLLPIPNPCSKMGKWVGRALGAIGIASEFYGSGDSNSFVAGTPVATPDGLRAIEDLRPGDKVLAYSESGEKTVAEEVTDLRLSNRERTIVTLTLQTGEKIEVTGGHPMHTPDGWRAAQLLLAGGQLDIKGSDGQLATVVIRDVAKRQEVVAVYNLEVANSHTYFVGETGVLTHNQSVGDNRTAGNQFRDEVAQTLRDNGHNAYPEGNFPDGAQKSWNTPWGRRFPDVIEYDPDGKPSRFFECKKGKSRYTKMQRKKDKYIRRKYGIPTFEVRSR